MCRMQRIAATRRRKRRCRRSRRSKEKQPIFFHPSLYYSLAPLLLRSLPPVVFSSLLSPPHLFFPPVCLVVCSSHAATRHLARPFPLASNSLHFAASRRFAPLVPPHLSRPLAARPFIPLQCAPSTPRAFNPSSRARVFAIRSPSTSDSLRLVSVQLIRSRGSPSSTSLARLQLQSTIASVEP